MTRHFDVVVIGAGAFGTTLASILSLAGRRVLINMRHQEQADEINKRHTNERYTKGFKLPKGLIADTDMQTAVKKTDIVLMVVPSKFFRPVAHTLGEVIRGDQILLHATKGIQIEPFKRMSEILHEETAALKIGVLSGPNLSGEILAGKPAGAVIASRFDEVIKKTQAMFEGSQMRIYEVRDVTGVEVGGAFKNIIALAAGAVDGMELGDNIKSLLLTRGLNEMARFGIALGAQPLTFLGLAGIGDLMATCASRLSRNNQVGFRMARGESIEDIQSSMKHVAEGVTTARAVLARARQLGLDLHVVEGVNKALYDGLSVHETMQWMLSGRPGREININLKEYL